MGKQSIGGRAVKGEMGEPGHVGAWACARIPPTGADRRSHGVRRQCGTDANSRSLHRSRVCLERVDRLVCGYNSVDSCVADFNVRQSDHAGLLNRDGWGGHPADIDLPYSGTGFRQLGLNSGQIETKHILSQ